jgi:hypothetical protein
MAKENLQAEKPWNLKECADFLGVSVHYLYKNYKKFPYVRMNRNIKFIPSSIVKHLKRIERMPTRVN